MGRSTQYPTAFHRLRWQASEERHTASPLAVLLRQTGVPRIEGAANVREEAAGLLRVAAEIEHALLIQYLYAFYSLTPEVNGRYREILSEVLKQEMGHLITVQGLLMLLGESPHLDRDTLLPGSAFEPIPFRLEPLSPVSLALYAAVEAPALETLPEGTADRLRQILEEAGQIEMGAVRRVGALYTMLYWLFQSGDAPEGPLTLELRGLLPFRHLSDSDFAEIDAIMPYLPDGTEWRAGLGRDLLVLPTYDRASALEALHRISAQGEGLTPMNGPDTHFEMFLEACDMAQSVPLEVRPLPSDPNTSEDDASDSRRAAGRITDPGARDWARLLNVRYYILLVMIAFSLRLSKDDADEGALRNKLTDWSLQEMTQGLSGTAALIVDMPLRPGSGERAAPPFELPDEPFPSTRDALVNAIAAGRATSTTLANAITGRGGLSLRQKLQLKTLAAMDAERHAVFEQWASSDASA